MQSQAMHFKARAGAALADAGLQRGLSKVDGFAAKRSVAMRELDDLEGLRTEAAAIRDRALADLDAWIEAFEGEATRRGATVLFAETGEDVSKLVIDICRRHGLTKAIKSKSMLSEEAQHGRSAS